MMPVCTASKIIPVFSDLSEQFYLSLTCSMHWEIACHDADPLSNKQSENRKVTQKTERAIVVSPV